MVTVSKMVYFDGHVIHVLEWSGYVQVNVGGYAFSIPVGRLLDRLEVHVAWITGCVETADAAAFHHKIVDLVRELVLLPKTIRFGVKR